MSGLSEAFTENDNAIAHLLRQVVYLFYPHQCIVIMEALLFHHVLFEDDITKLCCMHRKVFRSFCNILVEDKLISTHIQKEEAQQYKLYSRTYYYIHNIEAIDAIKWKVHTIVKKVKQEIGNFSEPQGYICPTCHHKYSLLDAASLLTDDKLNFECSICNDYLIDDDISQEQKKGQEKLEKIMSLVEPIIQYLKIVDDLNIDDNNFESTLMKYVPAFSDSLALYSIANKVPNRRKNNNNKNDDNNNNNNNNDPTKKAQATINVSITADDEDLKRERQKREDRNKKLRQNALPSWHQESTVGKAALGRLDFETESQFNDSETINSSNNINEMSDINDLVKTDPDASTLLNGSTTTTTDNINDDAKSSFAGDNIPPSLPSLTSDTLSLSNSITNSIPISLSGNSQPQSQSHNFITNNENTTSEEFDALSAYYSQLRQRQAVEEQEEEEEDEIEQEDIDYDGDDDNLDDFNDNDNDNEIIEKDVEIQNIDSVPLIKNENKSEEIKEEIDEDDFDLDMFESDNE